MSTYRAAAESILANLKRTYGTLKPLVVVNEKDFAHLDLAGYRQYREHMEKAGFKYLGDIAPAASTRSPTSISEPAMIRSMVSADGTILTGYYQFKSNFGRLVLQLIKGILAFRFLDAPRFFLKHRETKHIYDFSSELGGNHVSTSNAPDAGAFTRPATMDNVFLPYPTSLDAILAAHTARLKKAMAQLPAPTKVATLADVIALETRAQQLKNAHRAASGWLTRGEALAMAGNNPEIAELVYEEIQQLLREEAAAKPA